MNFHQEFLKAVQSNISLTKTISLKNYLPTELQGMKDENLPYVQAYGHIQAAYPYYYDMTCLQSCCLILTESGSGSLIINESAYTADAKTLALVNCFKKHRIEIKQSPWHYNVIFLYGNPIPYLFNTMINSYGCIHHLPEDSQIPSLIHKLMIQLKKGSKSTFFLMKQITDIILEIHIEKEWLYKHEAALPKYLLEIRHDLNTHYRNDFSLDQLEAEYHVSKFKICHEFTDRFGISPIQYLNQKRIEVSKEALLNTDKRIHEIGSMVGFLNTSHFIRMFKKQTGVTPLAYRNQTPAYSVTKEY